MGRKTTEIECDYCKKKFHRANSEIKRNARLGRRNFCDRACSARTIALQNLSKADPKNRYNLGQYSVRDELSAFRFTLKKCKNKGSYKKPKTCTIDAAYLKEVWDNQKGICPFTGTKMELRYHDDGEQKSPYDASLDRIDNSIGYEAGNVRFICCMANYARNEFSDEDFLEFWQTVVDNKK